MKKMICKLCMIAAALFAALNVSSCNESSSDGVSLSTNINSEGVITVSNNSEGSTNFRLESNSRWDISIPSADWLTAQPSSGEGDSIVKLVFETNNDEDSRTAQIIITATDGGENKSLSYILRQAGTSGVIVDDYINASTTSINNISGDGESGKSFNVTSNVEWTVSTTDSWINLKTTSGSNNGEVVFDVEANTDTENGRTGYVTLSAADENSKIRDVVITVAQLEKGKVAPDPYLTVDPVSFSGVSADGENGLSFSVSSNVSWSVAVDANSASWVTINTAAGTDDGTVTFNVSANSSTSARTATITVSDSDDVLTPATVTVQQKGASGGGGGTTDGWVETPEFSTTSSTQYVTHYITLNGKTARNYSLLWDKNEKIAYWVAYPMHSSYDGSTKRKDNYQYDPSVSTSDQPYLNSSYSGNYSRGHQIASSDRLVSSEANTQTFYFTNMTPQEQTFNGGIWNKLEVKVQDSWTCSDTLYVVTGAALNYSGATQYTTDKSGTSVAIPSHYYKVLVRSKNGNTGKAISQLSADEIIAVGFWFEHDGGWGTKDNVTSAHMKSVAEIEELTGYTFFPSVPAEVKSSYNASDWGM